MVVKADMNEIQFGKDRYHQQGDMIAWCQKNVGNGGWTYGTPKVWEGMNDNVWVVWSMFGNTTFVFKEPKHLSMFILKWA